MERILGIGGHFLRAKDPSALQGWYRDALGLETDEFGGWQQQAGPTVFAAFDEGSDYFGRPEQRVMLNFRVRDLAAMLEQLRRAGADVDEKTQTMDGVGAFGWVTDPEGNRIELWQPEADRENQAADTPPDPTTSKENDVVPGVPRHDREEDRTHPA